MTHNFKLNLFTKDIPEAYSVSSETKLNWKVIWNFKQPWLEGDIPAHGKEVGTRRSFKIPSIPNHSTLLWLLL